MADVSELKRQLEQLKSLGWEEFRARRREQDDVLRRRQQIQLRPELYEFGKDISIQSPDLEAALQEYVATRRLNPTKIDAICLEEGVQAQADVEDCRIWLAASYNRQNEGRKLDSARFEAMCRYGLAVERKLWRMPEEGEYSEDPEEALREREEWFKGRNEHAFKTIPVNPLEVSFMPLSVEPEVVIQESEIPFLEAYEKIRDAQGRRPTLDAYGKLGWMAESEPVAGEGSGWDRVKLRWIRREARDPKTGQWYGCEYVYRADGSIDDAELIREDVIPGGRSSYFITPAGTELASERSAHLRYRSRLYPLATLVAELNQCMTEMMAFSRMSTSLGFMYMELPPNLNPAIVQVLEEMGMLEGEGSKRRMVFRLPDPASGEIMFLPRLEVMPLRLDQAFLRRLEYLQEAIPQYKENRFLTGKAFEETREGAATSLLDQHQAAGLPVGDDLANSDATIRRMLEFERQCILYWDEGVEPKALKPYPLVTTGEEPLLTGGPEAGQTVTVTAQKLRRKMQLRVVTKGVTQGEQFAQEQRAFNLHMRGVMTDAQLIREIGYDDTDKQMRELNRDRLRRQYLPRYQELEKIGIDTLFLAITGMRPPAGPAGQGQPVQGQPSSPGIPGPGGLGQVGNALAQRGVPQGGDSGLAGPVPQ